MIDKIKTYLIPILLIAVGVLAYLTFTYSNRLAQKDNLIKASTDTLHQFKTTIGNQGAYISTLVGDKSNLITLLSSKDKTDSLNLQLIDSLRKTKDILEATGVKTITKIEYKHILDSAQAKVNINDSVKTKWYDAYVRVANDSLGVRVHTRDELLLTSKLKPNKGLWTGSTLTSYVVSRNPDTDISGITSVSTQIDKIKIKVRPFIGVGLNSDIKGNNIRTGFSTGLAITF